MVDESKYENALSSPGLLHTTEIVLDSFGNSRNATVTRKYVWIEPLCCYENELSLLSLSILTQTESMILFVQSKY